MSRVPDNLREMVEQHDPVAAKMHEVARAQGCSIHDVARAMNALKQRKIRDAQVEIRPACGARSGDVVCMLEHGHWNRGVMHEGYTNGPPPGRFMWP